MEEKIIDMALNGSGIRDTARVLGVNMNTVMSGLKKETQLQNINIRLLQSKNCNAIKVELLQVEAANITYQNKTTRKKNDLLF